MYIPPEKFASLDSYVVFVRMDKFVKFSTIRKGFAFKIYSALNSVKV